MHLAFFICTTKTFGSRLLRQRGNIRTALHPALNCQAYRCTSYDQFVELNQDVVARQTGVWASVKLETETGELLDPTSPPHPLPASEPTPTPPPLTNKPANDKPPLGNLILEAVSGGAVKTAVLATRFGVDAEAVRAAVACHPMLKAKQGGWIALAEPE